MRSVIYRSIDLSTYLPTYLSTIHLPTYLFPIPSSSAPTIPSHHLFLITVGRLNMWGYLVLSFFALMLFSRFSFSDLNYFVSKK